MGITAHNSMIVTDWNSERLEKVRIAAVTRFGNLVSEIIDTNMNGWKSFFISSCGSQVGRPKYEEHNKNLLTFGIELKELKVKFVTVCYANEHGLCGIIDDDQSL